jgi:hypothetical protein
MKDKPKSWRDILPIHPAADRFEMMSEQELRDLGEDIKKHGLHEGVALFDGMLLDGRNRLDAMEMIGIKVLAGNKLDVRHRKVEGVDPIVYVISKNIRRRHLTPEKKRDLIETLVKACPEKSDRQIADEAKSNRNTVGRIRNKLESSGDVSRSDTRTDRKGRKQAAHKAPTKYPAVIAAADRAEARAPRPEPAPKKKPDQIDLISRWDKQVRTGTLNLMHQIDGGGLNRMIELLGELLDEIKLEADRRMKECPRDDYPEMPAAGRT